MTKIRISCLKMAEVTTGASNTLTFERNVFWGKKFAKAFGYFDLKGKADVDGMESAIRTNGSIQFLKVRLYSPDRKYAVAECSLHISRQTNPQHYVLHIHKLYKED